MINIQLTLIDENKLKLTSFYHISSTNGLHPLGRKGPHHHRTRLLCLPPPQLPQQQRQRVPKQLQTPRLSLQPIPHLRHPLRQCTSSHMQTNWAVGVMILGLFEALVTLLIIFGDNLGGFLYVVSIALEIFFLVWPRFVKKTLLVRDFEWFSEVPYV